MKFDVVGSDSIHLQSASISDSAIYMLMTQLHRTQRFFYLLGLRRAADGFFLVTMTSHGLTAVIQRVSTRFGLARLLLLEDVTCFERWKLLNSSLTLISLASINCLILLFEEASL